MKVKDRKESDWLLINAGAPDQHDHLYPAGVVPADRLILDHYPGPYGIELHSSLTQPPPRSIPVPVMEYPMPSRMYSGVLYRKVGTADVNESLKAVLTALTTSALRLIGLSLSHGLTAFFGRP